MPDLVKNIKYFVWPLTFLPLPVTEGLYDAMRSGGWDITTCNFCVPQEALCHPDDKPRSCRRYIIRFRVQINRAMGNVSGIVSALWGRYGYDFP